MKIFIEHADEEHEFVAKLTSKLHNIKHEFTIDTWFTVDESLNLGNPDKETGKYKYLDIYDIIIEVVGEYTTLTNKSLNQQLSAFSEANNKYLIPLIYSPTRWSSTSWIMKNKIFPETGKSFSELSKELQGTTLDKVVEWIENILYKKTNLEQVKSKVISTNNKPIFISHSHDDADFAELLQYKLRDSGISCWIDSENLRIGQEWREAIDDGIKNSVATIAIMTPEARKSEYVTYEWAFAWGKDKKIFPILLKQRPLHPRLESLQYLDFTNRNSRPWN